MLGVCLAASGTCGRCISPHTLVSVMAETVARLTLGHAAVTADVAGPLAAQAEWRPARRYNERQPSSDAQLMRQVVQCKPWLEPNDSRSRHRRAARNALHSPLLGAHLDYSAVRCQRRLHLVIRNMAESFYTFVGVTLGALAYLILGPAVFIASQRTLWMIYLAQAFTGLATSSMFICAFCQALGRVRARGYPDTIRTKGFVSSSIFTAVVASGVVSPSLAGYIVQVVGYRMGTTYMFGLLLCWVPVTFAIWMKSLSSSKNSAIFVVNQQ
ncbi:MFS-type transporter SLC18B1-like [Ixodes scapularis]